MRRTECVPQHHITHRLPASLARSTSDTSSNINNTNLTDKRMQTPLTLTDPEAPLVYLSLALSHPVTKYGAVAFRDTRKDARTGERG